MIERHHKIIDEEFKKCINKCNSIDQLSKKFNAWVQYFNYYRFHTYTDLKYENQEYLYSPIEFLKNFYFINEKNKLIKQLN